MQICFSFSVLPFPSHHNTRGLELISLNLCNINRFVSISSISRLISKALFSQSDIPCRKDSMPVWNTEKK